MVNYNPLHELIRSRHNPPQEGDTGTLGPDDLPGHDMISLMEEARDAGYLTIPREPMGRRTYRLTAEGAEFLSGTPVG